MQEPLLRYAVLNFALIEEVLQIPTECQDASTAIY
jgi:hypothetical protein